jgi:CRISPR-associated endonuclease/helicase Cas3
MAPAQRILAKDTGETLAHHTLHCLKVAKSVVENLPFDEPFLASINADLQDALAVHDAGKAATGFQTALIDKSKKWGKRHEIISGSFASFQKLKEEVVFAILTHHKAIPGDGVHNSKGCLVFQDLPFDSNSVWLKTAQEWEANKSSFAVEWNEILDNAKSKNLDANLGLNTLNLSATWLSSLVQTKKLPYERRFYASLLRGLLMSCDHVASSDVTREFPKIPKLAHLKTGVTALHDYQKRARALNGNLILQAPTGSGKTLAALLWAGQNQKRNGRLFYCLPNTASINAMYLRLGEYYGKENIGLLHSRATSSLYSLLEEDEVSPFVRQRNARLRRSLAKEIWFPIRVCTPHQVLRYTLHGKGWEMMLSEFPNSCFIFDEIHAYDPVITGLVIATAKFLSENNASCLFLSATMPDFIKNMLSNELPAINFIAPLPDDPVDKQLIEKQRHNLRITEGTVLSNLDRVIQSISAANSTLIVCNHVPTAQTVFEEIKKVEKDAVLLHSRFCRNDRDYKEKTIQKNLPKVLVATQVVEVSLDVDFEQAFSEPAPIDALIQRFGRVNRKGNRPPANIAVFTEQINPYQIYNEDIVEHSLVELQQLSNPLREIDLIDAANRVYEKGYTGEDLARYNNALNHQLIKKFKDSLLAGSHNDWTENIIDRSDGTIEVLPSCLAQLYDKYQSEGLWLESNLLLVPIRTGSLSYLSKFIDKTHDPWIINKPYSDSTGLFLNAKDELE